MIGNFSHINIKETIKINHDKLLLTHLLLYNKNIGKYQEREFHGIKLILREQKGRKMRKSTTTTAATIAAIVSLLLFQSIVWAQENTLIPYITVVGQAEDWLDPDVALWQITFRHNGYELKDLKSKNDAEFAKVLKIADRLGVAQKDIVTGRISVKKNYKRDKSGNIKEFSHFTLFRKMEVAQHDLNRFDQFLNQLLIEGDLDVELRYDSTLIEKVKADLKLKAVKDARQKAVAMAQVLGALVGNPLIISEYPITTGYGARESFARQSGVIMQARPERIHVSQKIYIRFELMQDSK